jgi:hypothetical protein
LAHRLLLLIWSGLWDISHGLTLSEWCSFNHPFEWQFPPSKNKLRKDSTPTSTLAIRRNLRLHAAGRHGFM